MKLSKQFFAGVGLGIVLPTAVGFYVSNQIDNTASLIEKTPIVSGLPAETSDAPVKTVGSTCVITPLSLIPGAARSVKIISETPGWKCEEHGVRGTSDFFNMYSIEWRPTAENPNLTARVQWPVNEGVEK